MNLYLKLLFQDDDEEEEEDDEFLHKKAVPEEKPPAKKGPVKISIPSLKSFQDLDIDDARPGAKKMVVAPHPHNKPSGLLNMLPKPKAELLFRKEVPTVPGTIPKPTTTSLVPHSVTTKRKAVPPTTKSQERKKAPAKPLLPDAYESSSDEEGPSADFFSLTSTDTLPEVSKNEINLMVAKRAAKIAETTANLDRLEAQQVEEQQRIQSQAAAALHEQEQQALSAQRNSMDDEAMQVLVGGSRAKRARMENLDVIDLNHDQVMPSRDEWVRAATASSTTAPVRGELKDGPKGVARKKHQITYLAHQAKSNEAELQAIWAANRTTQRQSQSKYGW